MSDTEDDSTVENAAPSQRNSIAWLAVMLSITATAAVGYTLFQDWRATDDVQVNNALARLESDLSQSRRALAALQVEVGQLPRKDYGSDIDALQRNIDERLRLLDSLPARMSAIENSVAALAGISAGARETFLLAEAEYYLQIANAQLQLANNPQLASLALSMADERVIQLSNPALIDVRRALADERAALDVLVKPDIEGATLTLASLARVVESLPLAGAMTSKKAALEELDAEASGVDRAWASMKDAMSGLIKVTPPDQDKLAQLSPDAAYFLRNNIALQLQTARLALLRGEQAIFEQTLDDTSALLGEYFDGNSAQVISAQQTIAEIRDKVFTIAMPDISKSLRLLRQFRTLSETTE
ncbi:MAG: uroporphyrinogen-III C-methyltransferase [Proteobacteria bacterium]|nr:uroporphyrinogen-III C-methyltransferase [Pseudomonadota bacterium]